MTEADHDYGVADAAYQGAPGAFSEDAARAMLGPLARLKPCLSLAQVFEAVAEGSARAAVVPIENSVAGAVPGCADLLARYDVHIADECVRPIRHALVARPGTTLVSIRRVLSHPMALAQCTRFFAAHRHVEAVRTFDTAGAVAEVLESGRHDVAAIASRRASELYGATVLMDDLQDQADNCTRFVLILSGAAPAPDTTQNSTRT